MSGHDFDEMSKEQAITWFTQAPDDDLAEVVRTARPVIGSSRPVDDSRSTQPVGEVPIPLMLTSIRLPVELVGWLDEIAAAEGMNRSEAIRTAVAAFVRHRRGGVDASEAERALDVLRRVVGEHADARRAAA